MGVGGGKQLILQCTCTLLLKRSAVLHNNYLRIYSCGVPIILLQWLRGVRLVCV